MTGWIIYSKEDVEKNKRYIQMYVEKFAKFHVEIKTVIIQEIINIGNLMERDKPQFAINRSRENNIAKKLEQRGVRVFNSSKVTEIANNKAVTYAFLKDVVPFMPVRYGEKDIISGIGDSHFLYPYIIKSCSGHGGREVFMVSDEKTEKEALRFLQGEDYLIQQSCSDLGKDVRVYVVGNKIVASMLRTSTESFKSNYSLGGKAQAYELNEEERCMVKAITEKLPMDYAGIDFIFHNGRAVFNEIEDAVGARMLYAAKGPDIVSLFVDYIVQVLGI